MWHLSFRTMLFIYKSYMLPSTSIGIIGGADGPTAIFLTNRLLINLQLPLFILQAVLLVIKIFITNLLQVGENNYFLCARREKGIFGQLFSAFKEKRYSGILGGMLLRDIYIFLWSLLLVVPGIVKRYAYFCVPYLLAENPRMGGARAIALSTQMTKGCKGRIFVTHLSFLGWILLSLFAGWVGVRLVSPYIAATNAEIYASLRQNALEKGLTTGEELNIPEDENLTAEAFAEPVSVESLQ